MNIITVKHVLGLFLAANFLTSCLMPPNGETVQQSSLFDKEYKRPVDGQHPIKIHLNQVGYAIEGPKRAVIEATRKLSAFQVIDGDTKELVYEGTLVSVEGFDSWGGGPYFYSADFSELKQDGMVMLRVDEVQSVPVQLSETPLVEKTFDLVMAYFNGSRADAGDVMRTDAAAPLWQKNQVVDVRGGWFDASGDISKYMSHLSYANFMNPQQIPLTVWGLAWVYEHGDRAGLTEIQKRRVKSELLWGADYLVRMFSDEGFFYAGVFDRWTGDMAMRHVCAFEGSSGNMTQNWQTAYREGGGMAIAALALVASLELDGAYNASEYLRVAKEAFDHLEQHNADYCDDGKSNFLDDYTSLMAVVELASATEDSGFVAIADKKVAAIFAALHPSGYFLADRQRRPFWHASDAGLPVVALVRYAQKVPAGKAKKTARQIVKKHLSYLLKVTTAVPNPFGYARQTFMYNGDVVDGFFIPHDNETGYWWQGENARLGSLAAAYYLGARFVFKDDNTETQPYLVLAGDQLNWLLGMNPFGYSFMKGAGSRNPPEYSSLPNNKKHGDLAGGIANGVTGSGADGSGVAFWGSDGMRANSKNRWRWLEQWLPHSTWYMIAIISSEI